MWFFILTVKNNNWLNWNKHRIMYNDGASRCQVALTVVPYERLRVQFVFFSFFFFLALLFRFGQELWYRNNVATNIYIYKFPPTIQPTGGCFWFFSEKMSVQSRWSFHETTETISWSNNSNEPKQAQSIVGDFFLFFFFSSPRRNTKGERRWWGCYNLTYSHVWFSWMFWHTSIS